MTHNVPNRLEVNGYVTINHNSATIQFDEIHYALSTGQLNGGFHHILAVRNQRLGFVVETENELPGGSVSNYLAQEFTQIDLPINFCTALLTSASPDKSGYACVKADDIIVEAIITAGIEKTAQRAGDGYHYIEKDGEFHSPGTINIIVFTNVALTDGAMAKAIITITEAKTAILNEMNVKSLMSDKLATGSATDGIIFTIDTNGPLLTDTSTFSQLGDCIAKAVQEALKLALKNELQN